MQFEQISDTEFTILFSGLNDIGEKTKEGIRFFNGCCNVLVKYVNVDWDAKTIAFIIDGVGINTENANERMRGTNDSMMWLQKSYIITWEKEDTAQSYHTATSEEALRRQYKNSVACLCNHEKGDYKIASIDEE